MPEIKLGVECTEIPCIKNAGIPCVKYEDIKDLTTEEYFEDNQFSIDAFKKKYALYSQETYIQAVKRVCDAIASVEATEELKVYWSNRWFSEIVGDWWQPAGSIMQGAESKKAISTANCTTLSLGKLDDENEWDNLESIIRNTAYSVAKCAAYRQGLGIDFSRLRPRGVEVHNSAKESTGAIHWMKFIDSIGYYVGQSGRQPAMLFSLSCTHPDIEEFIRAKSDYTKIQNANISVQCTDAFYKAALTDTDWDLVFEIPEIKAGQKVYIDVHSGMMDCLQEPESDKWYKIAPRDRKKERIVKKVKASVLLELIAKNMHRNAEPGIQNIDIARKYSNSDALYDENSDYDSRCLSTNACCLEFNTEVLTNQGIISIGVMHKLFQNRDKSIEDLLIASYNKEKDVLEFSQLLDTFQHRHDTTVTLEIEEGDRIFTLECSADHPIYTINRGYIRAESLESGDDIKFYNIVKLFEKDEKDRNKYLYKYELTEIAKLVSIKINTKVKPLYDIEVEGNHNFIANGIVVHNSEQYLSRDSLCVLSSLNVGKFSTNQQEYIRELDIIGHSINRFLDNVNEYELRNKTYATPHQAIAIKKLRRTGAGITNLTAWLFKQGIQYGTEEGNSKTEDFMLWYNYFLYLSSEEIGKEKGNFGIFNSEKWKKAPFVSRLIKETKRMNKEFGVPILTGDYARNVTCSSVAPTGSLSLLFRESVMSYGIEPAFFLCYWKRTRISGKYEYYFCVPRIVREMYKAQRLDIPIKSDNIKDDWQGTIGKPIAEYINKYKDKFNFREATDIKPLEKLELMSRVMKWVDSSISVTYMLPENSTWKDVYDFILEAHKKEVKSIAAFPDKKMYGIVSSIPFQSLAEKLLKEGVEIHAQNFTDQELANLNLSRQNIENAELAPKRLPTLDADIYVITVKGERFILIVGIQNGKPYEIFGGHANGFGFKFNYKKGKLTKIKRGHYTLELGDIIIEDLSKQFTPTEQILFRMVSTSLRHGVPLKFITEQLQKATQDITSMGAAASRVLKKYIQDGEEVTGQKCTNCGGDLVYADGCVSCACGYSRC